MLFRGSSPSGGWLPSSPSLTLIDGLRMSPYSTSGCSGRSRLFCSVWLLSALVEPSDTGGGSSRGSLWLLSSKGTRCAGRGWSLCCSELMAKHDEAPLTRQNLQPGRSPGRRHLGGRSANTHMDRPRTDGALNGLTWRCQRSLFRCTVHNLLFSGVVPS